MKIGEIIEDDGEDHLIVNILENGDLVVVPMSVIDDECYNIKPKGLVKLK